MQGTATEGAFHPGLYVQRSNSLERLADRLAANLGGAPLPDPVQPERLVVGSRGMRSWLSRQLAQRLGVAANLAFHMPADALDRLMRVLGGAGEAEAWEASPPADPWAADALVWGVLAALNEHQERGVAGGQDPFRQLLDYLEQDPPEPVSRRRYALARQIADVLDRYTLLRPRWTREWLRGEGARHAEAMPWQPLLWRDLARRYEGARDNLAVRAARAFEQVTAAGASLGATRRLSIFGVSSLPPQHMAAFRALAELIRVDLYLPCPSREYWADLRSAREEVALRRRQQAGGEADTGLSDMAPEELTASLRARAWDAELPAGNPLLAACGRVARDFQVVLEDQDQDKFVDATDEEAAFDVPVQAPEAPDGPPASALAWLQSDMLAARHPAGALDDPGLRARRALAPDDGSVQLHACPGPTRQVEVLREVLLALLEDDPDLEPRDILVMTPDIEAYAPLISAVFDTGRDERLDDGTFGPEGAPRLPYRIEDLTLRRANPVADALLRAMELSRGRAEASAVLEMLELEPVQRRFGLQAGDLPQLQEWLGRSGIRWGLDAGHRRQEEQPADRANTWAFGLDRLALGVCMAAEHRLVQETAPVGDLEGGEVALLGRLLDFANTLQRELLALRAPRTVAQWAADLTRTVAALTRPPPRAGWLARRVSGELTGMGEGAAAAGMDRPVSLAAMTAHLDGRFNISDGAVPNSRGAVTFTGMKPMRSIPFPVICLLGMDEGAFPRQVSPPGFDLTARHRRLGDKDPRDEDRLIFLEAVQSAGANLVLLYSGQDLRTGEARDPAVVVEELRDLLDASFPPRQKVEPSRLLTRTHPLQAFSPRCFDGERPVSFHRGRMEAARTLLQARRQEGGARAAPFFTPPEEAAADEAPEGLVIALDELIDFFVQPAAHLLKRGLGLHLGERDDPVEDREPVGLDGLELWGLGDELLRAGDKGLGLDAAARTIRAEGRLPLGNPGGFVMEERREVAQAVLEKLDRERRAAGDPEARLAVDLALPAGRLVGSLDDIFGGGRAVTAGMGAPTGKRLVAPWLRCLAWTALQPDPAPEVRLVLGRRDRDEVVVEVIFLTLADLAPSERGARARERLDELLVLYRLGMEAPLPLLARSSHAFAQKLGNDLSPGDFDGGPPQGLAPATAKKLAKATGDASKAWQGDPNRDGEKDDPHLDLAFGDENPVVHTAGDEMDRVHGAFARLALRFWQPLFAALKIADDDDGEGAP